MPKPRSDSKLKSLPPHVREQLVTWLVDENLSYEKAKERLHMDYNVQTSVGALSNFYATECFEVTNTRARAIADQIAESMKADPAKFDQATIALVAQKAFERAAARDGDVKELQILAGILGDSARLRLKEKELALNFEKFRHQVKSDVEKGLDALHAEIRDNSGALALFEKFKAAVLRSVDGKEAA